MVGNCLKSLSHSAKIKHIRNVKIILGNPLSRVKITPQNKGKNGKVQGSKEQN